MGIEIELSVLLAMVVLGSGILGVFEVETRPWIRVAKWLVVCGITIGLYYLFGHGALAFPIAVSVVSVIHHMRWCRRHGIHALRATPRRRYYELRGWPWPE